MEKKYTPRKDFLNIGTPIGVAPGMRGQKALGKCLILFEWSNHSQFGGPGNFPTLVADPFGPCPKRGAFRQGLRRMHALDDDLCGTNDLGLD